MSFRASRTSGPVRCTSGVRGLTSMSLGERGFQIGESYVGTLQIVFGLLNRNRSHAPRVFVNQRLTDQGDSERRTGG
jgi:hypothetical protein